MENPFAPPFDFRPVRLGKKIEAGAEFIQTQCVFNLERMREFMRRSVELGHDKAAWILAGVYVPRTVRAVRYLREVPGIEVPDEVIARMESVPPDRQEAEGVKIAVEICRELQAMPGIAGIHLMSIAGDRAILKVVEELGLLPRPAIDESVAAV